MWFKITTSNAGQKRFQRLVQAVDQKGLAELCSANKENLLEAFPLNTSNDFCFNFSKHAFQTRHFFDETVICLEKKQIVCHKTIFGIYKFSKSEHFWQIPDKLIAKWTYRLRFGGDDNNWQLGRFQSKYMIKGITLYLRDMSSEMFELFSFLDKKQHEYNSAFKDKWEWSVREEDKLAIEWIAEIMNLPLEWDKFAPIVDDSIYLQQMAETAVGEAAYENLKEKITRLKKK